VNDLRKRTAFGFAYSVLERVGAQGINFVLSLLLARILSPDEYGTIALVAVFITICDVFVTYGFGNSLVVQKDADAVDFSTCFYFSIGLSAVVYAVVYAAAPLIAGYYGIEILTPVLRVMALRIPIAAVNSVQQAYMSRQMEFRKFMYATLLGTAVSGIAALIMAYTGFGVWALVAQYMGTVLISTVYLWFCAGWRPIAAFSWSKLKRLYQYGWKILVVGLIDTGYSELRNLVIAKRYTSADLAYYSKGNNFPALGMKLIEPSISKVLFASLSHCNDDRKEMRDITRKFMQLGTFLIFPVLMGLAAVARPLILVLLTEKWLPSVIFLQLGCVAYLFRPMRFISNSVIRATGRSDLLLKLDVVKKLIGILLLLVGMHFGVVGIAASLVLSNAVATVINLFPTRRLLNYGILAQLKDIAGNLLLSVLLWGVVSLLSRMQLHVLVLLVVQIITGVLFYTAAAIVTKNSSCMLILSLLKKYLRKKD